MKCNIFIQIILLLNLNLKILSSSEEDLTLQNLLDWCKKNDIIISPLINISYENGKFNITALEDIPAKTKIVKIPEKMILTVDKIIDYLNSPELKAQYDNFQNLKVDSYKEMNDELHKDEIFLSYLLYLIKHEKEKYQNTEFYKTFKELFLTIEKYVPNTPLLFTNEQKEFLSGTNLGFFSKEIRKIIDNQINILQNASFYNKEIDTNDFILKRLFVSNRCYNTTKRQLGEIILVPLFNIFPFDNLVSNARLNFKYKKNIKIITTYEIKKGKQITLFIKTRKSLEKAVIEGEMNSYSTSSKEKYLIPAFSPYIYYKYDIDDIKLIENHYFDLWDEYFEKNSRNFYMEHADVFKEKNANELWACNMVEENIKYYKEYVEDLMKRLNELFQGENEEKINMMNKALKGEWNTLNRKYERMVTVCGFVKKRLEKQITEDL